MNHPDNPAIDFQNVLDISYWSKKWEVSPGQIFLAYKETRSEKVIDIRMYLQNKGFAL